MADRSVSVQLRADVASYVADIRRAGRETTAAFSATQSATRRVGQDASVTQRALRDVGSEAERTAQRASDAAGQATSSVRDTAHELDGVLTAIAVGGGVAFGAIINASMDFGTAMSGVQAATHESADAMDTLREAAIQAGSATQFSATDAAGAIEALAKAGVSTQDILGGGLSGALSLAAAGEMEVADAAETAASALTQFGLAGADVPHVADLLAAGAGKAQGEVTDLAAALNQSGLIASQMGLSIEETIGTLSEFAAAGLQGSDAGTSFKTMLISLNPRSAEAAAAMDDLGISAFDAQGKFVGMTQFAGNLRKSLKNLTDEQRAATLTTIFGTDAIRAASIIYKGGGAGVQEWITKVNDAGYAAETAAIKTDNLGGDLERFLGALETGLIGAGEGAQEPLRNLVEAGTEFVDTLNDIPGPVKTVVTLLIGLGAAGAAIALIGGKIAVGLAIVQGRLLLAGLGIRTFIADLMIMGTTAMTAGAQTERSLTRVAAASGRVSAAMARFGPRLLAGGAALGALAVLSTGAGESLGITNTAMLTLVGSMLGPWGAALGFATGYLVDFNKAGGRSDDIIAKFNATIEAGKGSAKSYSDGLNQMRADAEAFAASVSSPNFFGQLGKGLTPGGLKNNLDVIFGGFDSSALGEIDAAILKSEQDMGDLELAARLVGDELKVGGLSDGALSIAEIDKVLQSAGPAMEALGISTEDLIRAVQDGSITGMVEDIQAWTLHADSAAGRAEALGAAVKGLGDDAVTTADSAEALSKALEALLSPTLDAEAATDQWRESLAELRAELNAKAGFDGFTKLGRANRDLTRGYVEDSKERLVALAALSTTTEPQMAKAVAATRREFIASGIAAGFSRKAITRRADALGLTPKLIRTVFQALGITKADLLVRELRAKYNSLPKKLRSEIKVDGIPKTEGQINHLVNKYHLTEKQRTALVDLMDKATPDIKKVLGLLDKTGRQKPKPTVTVDGSQATGTLSKIISLFSNIHDKSVTLTTTHVTKYSGPGNPLIDHAAGGFYSSVAAYAGGGMDVANQHQPEFALPGPTRIWREPETLGESYIPHANDWRRPGAQAVLEQTAAVLGGDVTWHAAGSWTPNVGPTMHKVDGGYAYAPNGGVGGHITVTGTLDSPLGLVRIVDARARIVAQEENQADRRFERHRGAGR